jgi:hypothetical protein
MPIIPASDPPARATPPDVREIKLTRGFVALVDAADYDWLMQWKWCAQVDGDKARAARTAGASPLKAALMHRLIMGDPPGKEIDHINGNTLDNRRSNLRVCSRLENSRNRGVQKNCKSKFKGVYLRERGTWRAQIKVNKKRIHLGDFSSASKAAKAYDEAALQYFGEFAVLNFPEKRVTSND